MGDKFINVYDAEAYDRRGGTGGNMRIRINSYIFDTDKKMADEIERVREEQKRKNYEYRKSRGDIREKRTSTNIVEVPTIEWSNDVDVNFDETGPHQATFALLASSKAGKTTLLKRIFEKYYDKPEFITVLFSINAHIPLYKDFDIKVSTVSKRALNIIKVEQNINKRTNNHYKFLNVFDDVLDVRDKKLLSDCILTYRNSNMSTIVSLQYPKLLSPAMRSNVNHLFFGKFNNDESKEQVIKMWLSSYFRRLGKKTLPAMVDMYDLLTKDHGFIYLCTLDGSINFVRLDLADG